MKNMEWKVTAKDEIEITINAEGGLRDAIINELGILKYGFSKGAYRKQNNRKQRILIDEVAERVNKVPVL